MTRKTKIFIGLALYAGIFLIMAFVLGSDGKNDEFQPQNEFFLDPWIPIDIGGIDFSINKAVLYLVARKRGDDLDDDLHRESDATQAQPRPDGGRARL